MIISLKKVQTLHVLYLDEKILMYVPMQSTLVNIKRLVVINGYRGQVHTSHK